MDITSYCSLVGVFLQPLGIRRPTDLFLIYHDQLQRQEEVNTSCTH